MESKTEFVMKKLYNVSIPICVLIASLSILYSLIIYYVESPILFAILLIYFTLQIFLVFLWVVSFIIMVLGLFLKKIKKPKFVIILIIVINLLGIMSVFFPFVVNDTFLEKQYSPSEYSELSIKKMSESFSIKDPVVYNNDFSNEFIVVYYKQPLMSFGSGHMIIALYENNKKFVDEVVIGELPITLIEWSDKEGVKFEIGVIGEDNYEYAKYWTDNRNKIGDIKIEFKINKNPSRFDVQSER